MAEQYTERPTEIEVFPLGSETDVILRKSIAESETTGENGDVATCWQCEERQIRVPGTVSAEDIAADFEAWWEYTPGTKAQSVEDVRTETVAQMSATCNAAIVGGVDVTLTGGETKHFSLPLDTGPMVKICMICPPIRSALYSPASTSPSPCASLYSVSASPLDTGPMVSFCSGSAFGFVSASGSAVLWPCSPAWIMICS